MSAQVERLANLTSAYRVTCAEHGLDRTVESEAHATNLAQLHDRKDHADVVADSTGVTHPPTFNLSAAADYLLICHGERLDGPLGSSNYPSYAAALDLFQALCGFRDEAATLAYARSIRENRTTATVIPF